MTTTYSITEAQSKLPGLLREVADTPITITRHDKAVAYLISKQRMDAITETLEILGDPEAMAVIRKARHPETHYVSLHDIDPD